MIHYISLNKQPYFFSELLYANRVYENEDTIYLRILGKNETYVYRVVKSVLIGVVVLKTFDTNWKVFIRV